MSDTADTPGFDPIEYTGLTDVGVKRSHNQDCFGMLMAPSRDVWDERGHLFIVADGMGAHAVGELASRIAVEQIPHMYQKHAALGPILAIRRAISEANTTIHQKGQANREFQGMGTTATSLVIRSEGAWVGHVGDSRAYRVRSNYIEQISFDHSLQWELAKRQQVNPDSIAGIPSNVIVRSLGPETTVQVDVEGPHTVQPGDIFVICSDGLSNQVTDQELGAILQNLPLQEATQFLVDLANFRGGPDNITLIVVKIPGNPEAVSNKKKIDWWKWIRQIYWIAPAIIVGSILAITALILVADRNKSAGFISFGAAVALIGSGIVGLFLRQRSPEVKQDYEHGPPQIYRRNTCEADATLFQKMAAAESQLIDVAKKNSWELDWASHDKTLDLANKLFKEGSMDRAFQTLCRAFGMLTSCQRTLKNKGEQFKPNW